MVWVIDRLLKSGRRSSEPVTRKKYVAVVEAVQQKGGEVLIFSSMHESGQRTVSAVFQLDKPLTCLQN